MRIKFVRVEEGKKTGSNPKATGITVGAAVPNPKKSPEQVQSQIARIKGKVQARAETKAGEVAHNKVMSQPGEHRISAGRVARSAGNKAGRRFKAGVKTGEKVKLPATISKSRGGGKGEIVKKVLLTKGARRAIANRGNRVGRHGYSVPSRGRRIPTEVTMGEQNSSTEILGNKIVEGFDSLLNESKGKRYRDTQDKKAAKARKKEKKTKQAEKEDRASGPALTKLLGNQPMSNRAGANARRAALGSARRRRVSKSGDDQDEG